MANTKKSKKSTNSNVKENKKKNNLLDEDMEKELVSSKEKAPKKIDYDEDYDDEDEEYENKEVRKTSNSVSPKPASHNYNLELEKIIPYVTLAVSVVTLIISIVVLCKVNDLDGTKVKASSNKTETETDDKDETPTVEDDPTTVEYDVSMFKSLDADAFLDLFDKKDGKEYIVNVGKSTCLFSQQFLPALQQSVKDYDYTLYYVSTTDSTIVDKAQEIIDQSEVFSTSGTAFGATPSTYVIKNGKVTDSFIGYDTYENFAKFLEKHNIKKK